jgi:hypothetical protein
MTSERGHRFSFFFAKLKFSRWILVYLREELNEDKGCNSTPIAKSMQRNNVMSEVFLPADDPKRQLVIADPDDPNI